MLGRSLQGNDELFSSLRDLRPKFEAHSVDILETFWRHGTEITTESEVIEAELAACRYLSGSSWKRQEICRICSH